MAKVLVRSVAVLLILAVSVLLAGLAAFHIVPIKILEGSVVGALARDTGTVVSMSGFERVFPLGLRAKDIALKDVSSGRLVINVDGAWIGFNPLSILSGGLGGDFKASLYGGIVSGSVVISPSGRSIEMKIESLSLFDIPYLQRLKITAGVPFDGGLSLELHEKGCPTGRLMVAGRASPGAEVRFGGLPLPVGLIDSAGLEVFADGSMPVGECHLVLKDLWFKGAEIEAHVTGSSSVKDPIEGSLVDIMIVVVPKGRLTKKEFMLSLIKDYRTGDGIYKIPVKGSLGEVLTE